MAKTKPTKTIEEMSKEELVEQFGAEFAKTIIDSREAGSSGASGSIPFPLVRLTYNKNDVEMPWKKGELVAGLKYSADGLGLESEGKSFGNDVEFILLKHVYKVAEYDNTKRKNLIETAPFFDSYSTPNQVDLISGKTIKQLREEGKKPTFQQFNLMLMRPVAGKGEEWAWEPVIFIATGNAYAALNKGYEDFNISNPIFGYKFRGVTKKVPTSYSPAWIIEIKDATPLATGDLMTISSLASDTISKFDSWLENSTTSSSSVASKKEEESEEEDDIDIDDIDIDLDDIDLD